MDTDAIPAPGARFPILAKLSPALDIELSPTDILAFPDGLTLITDGGAGGTDVRGGGGGTG